MRTFLYCCSLCQILVVLWVSPPCNLHLESDEFKRREWIVLLEEMHPHPPIKSNSQDLCGKSSCRSLAMWWIEALLALPARLPNWCNWVIICSLIVIVFFNVCFLYKGSSCNICSMLRKFIQHLFTAKYATSENWKKNPHSQSSDKFNRPNHVDWWRRVF